MAAGAAAALVQGASTRVGGRDRQQSDLPAELASARIGGLDFLWAVAAALVLIGHLVEGHPVLDPWLVSLSGLGVNVFFVLSGFLITKLILAEISSQGRLVFGGAIGVGWLG